MLLFIAVHVLLPSTYIVNRLNYELYKKGEVVVYDPSYLVANSLHFDGRYIDLPSNDVRDLDAYMLADRIVNDTDLASDYTYRDMIIKIREELDDKREEDKLDWKHWREFNFMRYSLEKTLEN